MRATAKRFVILTVAVFFLCLGLAGLILPVIPGIICMAVSLVLLSLISPSIRVFLHKHTSKYPKLHQQVMKLEGKLSRWIGEV